MSTKSNAYDPSVIEPKWQEFWESQGTFVAREPGSAPKFYALDMFPYPSGAGLHIGHPEGYTATDIVARYKRARGFNVLHPMGWDAFGLPAEQYAVKTGTHPAATTAANIDNFRRQIKRIGFAIDWTREINTTDPGYYRWTQWIFLQLFRRGLVYVDERPVWWCPNLRSVLANEEIVNGKSEVGNHPVERRNLRQVVLRITAYADRLLEGLAGVEWPESTKRQQAAWIGRSEGAEVVFELETPRRQRVTVYTTRPDTLFGATYLVLAPEHPLVEEIVPPERLEAVRAYVEKARGKSDLDRTDLAREKTGVFTGIQAINPVNGRPIPVWIADYVLVSYGTGAIMAVPAHDERDNEFAREFNLPIQTVVSPPGDGAAGNRAGSVFTGAGTLVHSGDYSGLDSTEGARRITADLEKRGLGRPAVNYRLRDWIFSRQRYWGEPIPMVWVRREDHERAHRQDGSALRPWMPEQAVTTEVGGETLYALPVPPAELPLRLPEVETYQPAGTGESPLATIPEWVDVWIDLTTGRTLPATGTPPEEGEWARGRRETNTMPQWAGSCWYHLRYLDPGNNEAPVSPGAEAYWKGPDLYIGGNEHAVLHLLYARFWHMVLHDAGVVSEPEPFRKLFHQGIILGEDGEKMSKSRGNVINPETVIDAHGADALRLFEMFLGPLEDMKPWNPAGIEGITRFLRKLWRECTGEDGGPNPRIDEAPEEAETSRLLQQTIEKVTHDMENLRFNTAISQLMILLNQISRSGRVSLGTLRDFLRLLAPMAPHICEELWSRLGGTGSIVEAGWPEADRSQLVSETVTYPVQVNGKVRAELTVAAGCPKEEVLKQAKALERVAAQIEGKTIRKEVFVPGKIVNFVVG